MENSKAEKWITNQGDPFNFLKALLLKGSIS